MKVLIIYIFTLSAIISQAGNNNGVIDTSTGSANTGTTNTTTQPVRGKNITGFDGIAWKQPYAQVKQYLRDLASNPGVNDPIVIVRDVPEREILIKRCGINYRYVFYARPEFKKEEDKSNVDLTRTSEADTNPNIARFFFVEVSMNLLPAKDLFEKLNKTYGRYTSANQDDKNRGAYIWQTDAGVLVQQVEAFDEKPFSRSLYYISKEMSDEIKKDLTKYQFAVEFQELIDIVP